MDGAFGRVEGAVEVGGDDPGLGHAVHGSERDAVALGEQRGQARADQFARDDHPSQPGQRRGSDRPRQQLGVEGHSDDRGRPVGVGDGGEDARRRHPLRHGERGAGVQAVEQPADQAEHVHHRGQQDYPCALARELHQPSVAVEFAQQVGGGTGDDLGRAGGSGAELDQGVPGAGRVSVRQREGHRFRLGEAAQCRRGPMGGAYQHLRGQPRHRRVDLVVGQPVVEQGDLGAEPPACQQYRDERHRGRQPQRRRAAGAEPGRSQPYGLLLDQGAQGRPVERRAEVQALLAAGAGQQQPVDPVVRGVGVRRCGKRK